MQNKPVTSLSIAIVCFNTPAAELSALLESLLGAIKQLREEYELSQLRLSIIDNSEGDLAGSTLPAVLSGKLVQESVTVDILAGHGNIGYGSAHNLVINSLDTEFHLLLNPDIEVDDSVLFEGVRYLIYNPGVSLVSPAAVDENGQRQYLCKRYPALFTLIVRGFFPGFLRKVFVKRLARYEMRELESQNSPQSVAIASGCFMLCRTKALQSVGGFDQRYFLYFEDFDLSLRLADQGRLVYLPAMKIVHRGGNAARKGFRHIRLFLRSAITFFNGHGWRLFSQA